MKTETVNASNLTTTIRQIVALAKSIRTDPVEAVQDYLTEKDSRFTRTEVERLIRFSTGKPIRKKRPKHD